MLWYSISPTASVLVGPEVADTSGLERTAAGAVELMGLISELQIPSPTQAGS